MRKSIRLLSIIIFCIFIVQPFIFSGQVAQAVYTPTLTATGDGTNNMVQLSWNGAEGYHYSVYQKDVSESDDQYQSIPLKSNIRVLNIYPDLADSDSCQTWMANYGSPDDHQMTVDKVSLSNFNSGDSNINYSHYLAKSPDGSYNYDVLYFGGWDSNNNMDLNANSKAAVASFLDYGGGCLFGHDTTDITNKTQFVSLAQTYLNMQCNTTFGLYGDSAGNSTISVVKKGFLTNYPYLLGDSLTVPASHSSNQFAMGDIWMKYNTNTGWGAPLYTESGGEAGSNNFYLTTWNNAAMIQIGHSNGAATVDEQKILTNTLYYLAQISTDSSFDDHLSQDVAAPDSVSGNVYALTSGTTGKTTISWTAAEDNGSIYNYKLKAIDSAGNVTWSDPASATVTTGVAGYALTVDQNSASVDPGDTITADSLSYDAGSLNAGQTYYAHIKTIDNAGNTSSVFTIAFTTPPPTYIISGNAGTAEATLSYTDSTAKTATTDGTGAYSFTVSDNWSGTVTPTKTDYIFTPASKAYNNVTADQTGQDYTAEATIDIAAITGVTAPVTNAVPVSAINSNSEYTGTVTWGPATQAFAPGTTYTATINITPKTGYTLTGVPENFFTVVGATTVTNAVYSGVVTAAFPATEAATYYAITGTVEDEDNIPVSGATVTIMSGSREVAQTTSNTNGEFSIFNIPNGTYNLVISKHDQIITLAITVSDGDFAVGTIQLPTGMKNSVVDIKAGTPEIVVDQLNNFFSSSDFTAADQAIIDGGGEVEIKLEVQQVDENTAANADSIIAAAGNRKTIGMFLNLTLSKTLTPNGSPAQAPIQIDELDNLLIIDIPLSNELQGKSGYVVYRYHGTNVDTITQTPNADGEKIQLSSDGRSIKLYIKKFSTYVVAYTTIISGGGGSSDIRPRITAEDSPGGHIKVSADDKTAAITSEEGYLIYDLLVDGKSVGAASAYSFTDNKSHKIKAVFLKLSALPYYLQNGQKVFIGFTAVLNNNLKYIAPQSVSVQFDENPKTFLDISNHWAKSNIDFVTEREIFSGTSKNIFAPKENMTRAMFVTVIGRLYESSYGSIKGNNSFSDVDPDAYYATYIAWAQNNGIISGIGNNKFSPNTAVSREQMAVIMYNFAKFLGKSPQGAWMINLTYPDKADISDWAMESTAYCQLKDIINGSKGGLFVPKAVATRAEVATVIAKYVTTILE